MNRTIFLVFLAICFLFSGIAVAADQDRDRVKLQDQYSEQDRIREREQIHKYDDDLIYGSQLMTERERYQYREELRNMQTSEQREQFRRQHHEKMQQRAKAKGVRLVDPAPPEPMHKGSWGGGSGGKNSGRK